MTKSEFIFCSRLFKVMMILSCIGSIAACAMLIPSAMEKEQAYNEHIRAMRCANYDMPKEYCVNIKGEI